MISQLLTGVCEQGLASVTPLQTRKCRRFFFYFKIKFKRFAASSHDDHRGQRQTVKLEKDGQANRKLKFTVKLSSPLKIKNSYFSSFSFLSKNVQTKMSLGKLHQQIKLFVCKCPNISFRYVILFIIIFPFQSTFAHSPYFFPFFRNSILLYYTCSLDHLVTSTVLMVIT